METKKTLTEQLCEVQGALKAPKGQYNSFGKYAYRSCEDIVEAVKPLLTARGLLLTITDEIVLIGARFYVRATATVTDGKAPCPTPPSPGSRTTRREWTRHRSRGCPPPTRGSTPLTGSSA